MKKYIKFIIKNPIKHLWLLVIYVFTIAVITCMFLIGQENIPGAIIISAVILTAFIAANIHSYKEYKLTTKYK